MFRQKKKGRVTEISFHHTENIEGLERMKLRIIKKKNRNNSNCRIKYRIEAYVIPIKTNDNLCWVYEGRKPQLSNHL